MNTPIADFVRAYAASGCARLHMPGHKGRPFLGCEALDVTEIAGADELYGAAGIIAQSEKNAGALFGSGRTFYAAEGSSQCIRAMLALAVWGEKAQVGPVGVVHQQGYAPAVGYSRQGRHGGVERPSGAASGGAGGAERPQVPPLRRRAAGL